MYHLRPAVVSRERVLVAQARAPVLLDRVPARKHASSPSLHPAHRRDTFDLSRAECFLPPLSEHDRSKIKHHASHSTSYRSHVTACRHGRGTGAVRPATIPDVRRSRPYFRRLPLLEEFRFWIQSRASPSSQAGGRDSSLANAASRAVHSRRRFQNGGVQD